MHLLKSNRLRTSVRLSQKPCTSLLPRSSWTRYDGKAYHGLEKMKNMWMLQMEIVLPDDFLKKIDGSNLHTLHVLFT